MASLLQVIFQRTNNPVSDAQQYEEVEAVGTGTDECGSFLVDQFIHRCGQFLRRLDITDNCEAEARAVIVGSLSICAALLPDQQTSISKVTHSHPMRNRVGSALSLRSTSLEYLGRLTS